MLTEYLGGKLKWKQDSLLSEMDPGLQGFFIDYLIPVFFSFLLKYSHKGNTISWLIRHEDVVLNALSLLASSRLLVPQ